MIPPTLDDWLFTRGLYDRVVFTDEEARIFQRDVRLFSGTLDAYCVACDIAATPFRGTPTAAAVEEKKQAELQSAVMIGDTRTRRSIPRWSDRTFEVRLACTRKGHVMSFFFGWTPSVDREGMGTIEKIGQIPSIADIAFPETTPYRKVLGDSLYREYRTGLGLYAHGVGIGAFIYLRRVFEHLVEQAHEVEMKVPSWDETVYQAARMKDRIVLLSHQLPVALVENAAIYGILSRGLHELSEDDCRRYFSTVKEGIDMVLDEILAAAHKATASERLKRAVATVAGDLSRTDGKSSSDVTDPPT